jgi:hypothetical protein
MVFHSLKKLTNNISMPGKTILASRQYPAVRINKKNSVEKMIFGLPRQIFSGDKPGINFSIT